jgi:hypothetical protein
MSDESMTEIETIISQYFLPTEEGCKPQEEVAVISDKYRYIYIPVHKCATTSTLNWLTQIEGAKIPIQKYLVKNIDEDEKLNDYFRWLIVRNPFDRLVSAYFSPGKRVLQKIGINEDVSFSDFIKIICNTDARLNTHVKPQLNFIKCRIDYIVRFENLHEDLRHIAQYLNFPEIEYPHLNFSDKGHYRQYYNYQTRKLVEEKYKESLTQLGYTF